MSACRTAYWRATAGILPVLLLVPALAGCTGSGFRLRGVGAPQHRALAVTETLDPMPVSEGIAISDAGATGIATTEGRPLNVADEPPVVRYETRTAEIPPQPEMGVSREAAISQIRAKAAATGKKPPNVFDIPESKAQPLTEAERAELRRLLDEAARDNAASVPPAEAAARQESLKRLLRKARTHYDQALSSIEK